MHNSRPFIYPFTAPFLAYLHESFSHIHLNLMKLVIKKSCPGFSVVCDIVRLVYSVVIHDTMLKATEETLKQRLLSSGHRRPWMVPHSTQTHTHTHTTHSHTYNNRTTDGVSCANRQLRGIMQFLQSCVTKDEQEFAELDAISGPLLPPIIHTYLQQQFKVHGNKLCAQIPNYSID